MSIILAIDAAGIAFAVALVVDGEPVREIVGDVPRDHSRSLLPAIDDLMRAAPGAIGGIAVISGPGSFSGIRVGLAVAGGLGLARALPIVGVGTLQAVGAVAGAGSWLAIHPAGRGTFAVQPYLDGLPAGPLRTAAEADLPGQPIAGEGAAALGGREVSAGERCRMAASLALPRFASAGSAQPTALYLREPNITAPRARQVATS